MAATNQVAQKGRVPKLNRFEEATLEQLNTESFIDALADISDNDAKMDAILRLVVSAGDDCELGRLIRTQVEQYVLTSPVGLDRIAQAELDEREARRAA